MALGTMTLFLGCFCSCYISACGLFLPGWPHLSHSTGNCDGLHFSETTHTRISLSYRLFIVKWMELPTTTQKLQLATAKEHEVASEEMSSRPALEEGLSSSEFVPPWLKVSNV